jgi:hypothetical protein
MNDSVLESLVNVTTVQEQNAKKNKELQNQLASLKSQVLGHMIEQKRDIIPVGNDMFVRIKTKVKKPPIDRDFLSASFCKFLKTVDSSDGITPELGTAFANFVFDTQDKLKVEGCMDVEVTRKRPVGSMIMCM